MVKILHNTGLLVSLPNSVFGDVMLVVCNCPWMVAGFIPHKLANATNQHPSFFGGKELVFNLYHDTTTRWTLLLSVSAEVG